MSQTAHAIRIHENGSADVLRWEEVAVGEPGPGEVRVRHEAVGLNFVDIYYRIGLYPAPLPSGLGQEAAGVVEAVGEGVTQLRVGDRVAYAGGPVGAYAEARVMPAAPLLRLPDSIDMRTAAAMMLQGMTAAYLLTRTYVVQPGDTILIHAAAGGVGLIVCQWAKALGATVIGTASTEEKAALAKAHGCDHTILYTRENVAERVREITGGRGVPVVYDSVGKDTLEASLDSLAPLGTMVSFGNASGPLPPIEPLALTRRGSLFFTRPSLFHYTAQRADLETYAQRLFAVVQSGQVKIEVKQTFPLREAAAAQRALESRQTTGSTILLP